MSLCEICWAEASRRQGSGDHRPVVEIYNDIIAERWGERNHLAVAKLPVTPEDE